MFTKAIQKLIVGFSILVLGLGNSVALHANPSEDEKHMKEAVKKIPTLSMQDILSNPLLYAAILGFYALDNDVKEKIQKTVSSSFNYVLSYIYPHYTPEDAKDDVLIMKNAGKDFDASNLAQANHTIHIVKAAAGSGACLPGNPHLPEHIHAVSQIPGKQDYANFLLCLNKNLNYKALLNHDESLEALDKELDVDRIYSCEIPYDIVKFVNKDKGFRSAANYLNRHYMANATQQDNNHDK